MFSSCTLVIVVLKSVRQALCSSKILVLIRSYLQGRKSSADWRNSFFPVRLNKNVRRTIVIPRHQHRCRHCFCLQVLFHRQTSHTLFDRCYLNLVATGKVCCHLTTCVRHFDVMLIFPLHCRNASNIGVSAFLVKIQFISIFRLWRVIVYNCDDQFCESVVSC